MMKKVLLSLSIALISVVGFSQSTIDTIYFNNFNQGVLKDSVIDIPSWAFDFYVDNDSSFDNTQLIKAKSIDNVLQFDLSSVDFSLYDSVELSYNLFAQNSLSYGDYPLPDTNYGSLNIYSLINYKLDSTKKYLNGYYYPSKGQSEGFVLLIDNIKIIGYKEEIVNIPDTNFLNALIDEGVDLNKDGKIQKSEANQNIDTLDISNKGINDLIGIEAFNAFNVFNCSNNNIDDISVLTKGLDIHIYKELNCSFNKIEVIYCDFTLVNSIICNDNNLRYLNVHNNTSLSYLDCINNPNLDYICVHSVDTQPEQSWVKDSHTEYSTTCEPLALSEKQSTEKAQILKAYNLDGQEVPVNTKGEVIILLYDNGVREKTYVAE